jgi:hypothetical protein
MKLDYDTAITLIALDRKGEPHTIYEGAMSSIAMCPPIEEWLDPMQWVPITHRAN